MVVQRKQGETPFFPANRFFILSCSNILMVTRHMGGGGAKTAWTDADPLLFQILSRTASHGLPNLQRNRLPLAGKRDGK